MPTGYSVLKGTFPRVTHPSAARIRNRSLVISLDLHVLSLPPAFVLSQDQTLKLKRLTGVLDVRTVCTSQAGLPKEASMKLTPESSAETYRGDMRSILPSIRQ